MLITLIENIHPIGYAPYPSRCHNITLRREVAWEIAGSGRTDNHKRGRRNRRCRKYEDRFNREIRSTFYLPCVSVVQIEKFAVCWEVDYIKFYSLHDDEVSRVLMPKV